MFKIYRNEYLTDEQLAGLDAARDHFLGPVSDLTSKAPIPDPDNSKRLLGGTAFERCGQRPVKDGGQCYSLMMTHQRQRALVGPTSSGKFYDNLDNSNYSFNLEIRGKVLEVRIQS